MLNTKKDIQRLFKVLRLDHEKINYLREMYLKYNSLVRSIQEFIKVYETEDQLKKMCMVAYAISISETRYLGYDPTYKVLEKPEVAEAIIRDVDPIIREKKTIWNYKEEPRKRK
ncbi:MAG: hypothetical protein NE328_19525 [Lentisphaeraceae bacterium]|nr:hypothetical protein [Lentisphaeraceae bacterium]